MKKIYALIIAFTTTFISFGQATDLYISMYGEGSSSNKFIEIYNGTGVDVDLSNYSVEEYTNGAATASHTETFSSGTILANGDVYVIANNNADPQITGVADITSSVTFFNGDDAIALLKNGTVIDVIGEIGVDPGSGWDVAGVIQATKNHTLTRKSSVCSPNDNWVSSAGTDANDSEWIVTGRDTGWGDLGSFTGCASSPVLSITSPTPNETLAPTTSVDVAFTVQNFNVAQTGGDGHIAWDLDNSGTWTMQYDTNPIALTGLSAGSHTVDVKLVDNNDADLNPSVETSVSFNIASYTQVTTLADLRAGTLNEYYHFTGEAYVLGGYASQNGNGIGYVQDATAGIKVYVHAGTTTNQPTIGDGVSDLKGKLIEYHGVLEIELTEDFTLTGNNQVQTPQIVTIADYLANHEDYESELIRFENVTIDPDGDTEFQANHNYDVSDGTDTVILRTSFPDLENQTIPTGAQNITGIAGEYNSNPQFYPRNINDFEAVSVTTPTLTITDPSNGEVFTPNITDIDVTFTVQNFNVAQSGGDGHVAWRLDNGTWNIQTDTNPIALTGLSAGSHTVDVKLVDNNDADLNPSVETSVSFNIASYTQVTTLADLRAGTLNEYYHFTGEAYVLGGYASQNGNGIGYVQDATAGIKVYVHAGTTTNQPTIGDGVSDLKGKLIEYHGVLEIELTEDFTLTGNNQVQTPQIVTIADYLANHEDYESELIRFENVTIDPDGDTEFQANHNYDVSDGTDTVILRTSFPDLENQTIPTGAQNITGIAGEYNGTPQFYPRNINDFEDYVGIVENNIDALEVYPNPAGNQVYVTSASGNTKQIAIYDVLGKIIFQAEINDGQAINISQLKAGVYMMKVVENNHLALRKIIVK